MDQERQERFWDLLEADQNDPDVQYALGLCYLNGDGTEPDGAEADKWLRRAAEPRDSRRPRRCWHRLRRNPPPRKTPSPRRRCRTGVCGQKRETLRPSIKRRPISSPSLPRRAVRTRPGTWPWRQNRAIPRPACCWRSSTWTGRSTPRRADLLRNAADCNLGQAAELLGECYARGQGVQQDPAEAERRFIQAAQLDGGERMVRLAVRYALGDGVAPSPGKAMNWVKKARDSGLLDAREQYDALCTAARDAAAAQQEAQAAQQAAQQAEEEARRAEALRRQEQAQAQRSEAEKAGRKKLPSAGPGSRPIVRKRLPVSPRTRPGSRHRHRRRKPKRKPRGQRKQPRRQKPPERPTPSRPSAGPGHRLWYTASALF